MWALVFTGNRLFLPLWAPRRPPWLRCLPAPPAPPSFPQDALASPPWRDGKDGPSTRPGRAAHATYCGVNLPWSRQNSPERQVHCLSPSPRWGPQGPGRWRNWRDTAGSEREPEVSQAPVLGPRPLRPSAPPPPDTPGLPRPWLTAMACLGPAWPWTWTLTSEPGTPALPHTTARGGGPGAWSLLVLRAPVSHLSGVAVPGARVRLWQTLGGLGGEQPRSFHSAEYYCELL